MTDIVKGMVKAYHSHDSYSSDEAMRAALLWFAEHVTAEMVTASREQREARSNEHLTLTFLESRAISAAIRAAAGEEGK